MSPSQLRQLLLANAYRQQRMADEEPFAVPVPDTKRAQYRWKPRPKKRVPRVQPDFGKAYAEWKEKRRADDGEPAKR